MDLFVFTKSNGILERERQVWRSPATGGESWNFRVLRWALVAAEAS